MCRFVQSAALPTAVGLGLLGVHLALFLPYMSDAKGRMAADYALHVPNLLVGLYWRLANGLGAVPWFDPAQCGGVPYHADPNVGFYALPQALAFATSMDAALKATFAAFAAIGFFAAYGLMRSSFAASRAAALASAGLFLFNGFFAARMLAGHLTFHAFMLAPAEPLLLCSCCQWFRGRPLGPVPRRIFPARIGRPSTTPSSKSSVAVTCR